MLSFVPFLPFFVFFVLFSKNPEFDFIIEQRKEKKYFSSVCLHVRKCVSPSVKARADFLDIFYFLSLKKKFHSRSPFVGSICCSFREDG